jgi:hypothetical protein
VSERAGPMCAIFVSVQHPSDGTEVDCQQYVRLSRVSTFSVLCKAACSTGHRCV